MTSGELRAALRDAEAKRRGQHGEPGHIIIAEVLVVLVETQISLLELLEQQRTGARP